MMHADVSQTDVLVLTSLCWDKETRKRVAHKLSSEMKLGSVVVDYRGETFSDFGLDFSTYIYGGGGANGIAGAQDEQGHDSGSDSGSYRGSSGESNNNHVDGASLKSEEIDIDMTALSRALLEYTSVLQHFHGPFTTAVFSSGGGLSGQINRFPHKNMPTRIAPAKHTAEKNVYSAKELLALKNKKYSKEQLLTYKKKEYSKEQLLAMRAGAATAGSHMATGTGKDNDKKSSKSGDNEARPRVGADALKCQFELRSIIEGPVSWNSRQQLYIHVKE